uniref:G-protein coupled receptors family 1 profile domain-containing protein n=1 Tax=Sphenodon punctatus TaxID=8508 RepID=A0A8D0GER7_SPHPU
MELPHNASNNHSWGPPGSTPYSPAATALILLAVLAMALATLLGNVLVVLAVCTSRALRAPQNLFLVSLAAADILVATLIIPFSLANEVMGYWCFGRLWCSLYLSLDVLFCTASIMHLCAISLDRYWAVTRAARYNLKRNPRRVKCTIGTVWAIAAFVSLPPLFKAKPWAWECHLHDDTWYVLASCTASFFAPCLIMVAVYCRIYHVAKHRSSVVLAARRLSQPSLLLPSKCDARRVSFQHTGELESAGLEQSRTRLSRQWGGGEATGDNTSQQRTKGLSWALPQRQRQQQRRSRDMSISTNRLVQQRERRFTFVLAVVIGVFVLCWFPFFFTYSLESVCGDGCRISRALFSFFFWIGYCNSSLNPIIYTIFNRDFRRAFHRLLTHACPSRT